MARKLIKKEPTSTPTPGPTPLLTGNTPSIGSNTMGPPPSRKFPTDELIDTHSASVSFIRSHAPSAETRHHRGTEDDMEEQEPMLLEMRALPGGNNMLTGSPSSTQNADGSFAHQSFAHTTFTDIGMKLRAFNDTLGDLQRLGVSHVAALPELVLVGDQSAGKSSLMSGLARVNLPRSAGVGTRCPLHIRLIASNNTHWSCTVSLQQDYEFQPKGKIKKSDVTASNPFPPWFKKSHRDTKIFKTIFNPAEIEEVLRWAQVAILNPNSDHELYVPGEGSVAKEMDLDEATRKAAAQFSPNIISLEIKGPELPDLSFYDLPGVFLSPDQEDDEYIVKVVRNLTRDYIRRETAIIMWALPMNADPENSISLGIIRESKAADRTIGIMTKADKLAPENEAQWLAMFRGEKQSVGHGFFATSRPPNEALESASNYEELFFSHEIGTWPAEFDPFKSRCGVDLLGEYISRQLGDAFCRSLPSIKTKVYNRLREVESQLSDLPELPANVEHEVKKSLDTFLARTKLAIKESDFSSKWNDLNNQFWDIIVKIKPTCRIKEPTAQTIDLSETDTEVSAVTVTPSKRPRPSDSTMRPSPSQSPAKRRHMVNGETGAGATPTTPTAIKQETSFSAAVASPALQATEPQQNPFSQFRRLGYPAMDIDEIRREVRKMQRPGMPRDLVPDQVREKLCLTAVQKWHLPLETYISRTADLLSQTTNLALESSLGVLRRRLIYKKCQEHLSTFINNIVTIQRARLSEIYDQETYQMYTMNEETFKRHKASELAQLQRGRSIHRLKALTLIDWDYEIKRVEQMTDEERMKEQKMLNLHLPRIGKDPYETEIEVAAFVRGYYLTSAMRFVEGVTMNVNSFLLRKMGSSELDYWFWEQLRGKGGRDEKENVYENLMEEDENTSRLREQLRGEIEKLSEAMKSINSLERSSGAGADTVTNSHTTATTTFAGAAVVDEVDVDEDEYMV